MFRVILLLVCCITVAHAADPASEFGRLEYEVKSEYSHIRVRKKGNIRTLLFVRDTGTEVGETQMDIARPHVLRIPYTRAMFASHLIHNNPQDLLLIGVGGGAMVRYIQHQFPAASLDGVEIDDEVLKVADKYFEARENDQTTLRAADGFKFIEDEGKRYDVIFMDAFLKPSDDTDSTGVPLNLKTQAFYKRLIQRLKPDGVVAFNLNLNERSQQDLQEIKNAFAQTYVFRASQTNAVIVASTAEKRIELNEMKRQAYRLDRELRGSFSYLRLVSKLK